MEIGIVGVRVDNQNKEYLDLSQYISSIGHKSKMIFADSFDVNLANNEIEIYQTAERPSGAGGDRELLDVDCAILRHLGIIRDYEQFMFRVFCIRTFEEKNVYVMNPIMDWLMATDKFGTLVRLARHKLPIPETESSEQMFVGYEAMKRFKSVVVKPLRSAMGFGVFKLDDPDVGMHVFSYFANINKPIYVQKYFEKKGGGDYRVIVVGGQVIGAEFRKGATWKSNITQGAEPKKAKPDKELKELAVKATEAMNLEFAGVDIADTDEGYKILEINPTLSWQGFRKVTGINPAEHIVDHLVDKVKN